METKKTNYNIQMENVGTTASGEAVYSISVNKPTPQILYCKTRAVKSPVRAHPSDAGIDFFFPDKFTDEDIQKSISTTGTPLYITGHGNLVIPAFGSLLLSSGTKWIIPDGYALIFFNKSGVASKKHLVIGACVCDTNYRGEIHINLINTSAQEVVVSPGEKIAQAVLIPIGNHIPFEVDDISKYAAPTDRGEGGFGSSGTK